MPEATRDDEVLTPRELIERFRSYGLAFELEKEADLFASDGVVEWPMAARDHDQPLRGALRRGR
jgi:hypothetical protein